MICDGKISKLSPHPFKDGHYVGEILTDGGRGCVFEMNPRRFGIWKHAVWLAQGNLDLVFRNIKAWVEIDDETFKVLDWGI